MAKPRPSREIMQEAERVAKHSVKLIEFLLEWEERELRELPFRNENVAQSQGRCQVLKELNEFFKAEAPKNRA